MKAPQHEKAGSDTGQPMWDLRWTEWYWERFLSRVLRSPPRPILPPCEYHSTKSSYSFASSKPKETEEASGRNQNPKFLPKIVEHREVKIRHMSFVVRQKFTPLHESTFESRGFQTSWLVFDTWVSPNSSFSLTRRLVYCLVFHLPMKFCTVHH